MSAIWVIAIVAVVISFISAGLAWAMKTTPSLEDSMSRPRDVPVHKGIADEQDESGEVD